MLGNAIYTRNIHLLLAYLLMTTLFKVHIIIKPYTHNPFTDESSTHDSLINYNILVNPIVVTLLELLTDARLSISAVHRPTFADVRSYGVRAIGIDIARIIQALIYI